MNALVKIHTASPGPTSYGLASTTEEKSDGLTFAVVVLLAIAVSRSRKCASALSLRSNCRSPLVITRWRCYGGLFERVNSWIFYNVSFTRQFCLFPRSQFDLNIRFSAVYALEFCDQNSRNRQFVGHLFSSFLFCYTTEGKNCFHKVLYVSLRGVICKSPDALQANFGSWNIILFPIFNFCVL